jgi:hypothetical protein
MRWKIVLKDFETKINGYALTGQEMGLNRWMECQVSGAVFGESVKKV